MSESILLQYCETVISLDNSETESIVCVRMAQHAALPGV